MMLGNYEVVRPLGSGGMSDAFLARSPAGRLVVLKKPRSYDPELLSRMRDEGRLGVKIFHSSLVETLDVFEHQGVPVLALGFVEGPTVDELRKAAPLPAPAVARIGCQIAEALGAIHHATGDTGEVLHAVHRDVSARNIIVTKKGDAVLIDLGIARTDELRAARTETGMVLGTLRYMAPELVDGVKATPCSDFYSLGCVMIEAATGQPVFQGTPSEMAGAIVTKGPLASEAAKKLDPKLRAVLMKITAMVPADRFQEAHELSAALRVVAGTEGERDLARRAAQAITTSAQPLSSAESTEQFAPERSMPPPNFSVTAQPQQPMAAPFASQPMSPLVVPEWQQMPAPPPVARPKVNDAPLELAVEGRQPKTRVIEGNRDHYPKLKQDYRWVWAAIQKGFAVIILLGAAIYGYKWWSDQNAIESQAQIERKAIEEAGLIRKAMEDTADCKMAGALWAYTDKQGSNVIVDDFAKVPKQYRKSARCAVAAHPGK